jgi:hypothetical protein
MCARTLQIIPTVLVLTCSLTHVLIRSKVGSMTSTTAAKKKKTAKKQPPPVKVPITERALIQRLNRKLKADDQRMVWSRGENRWFCVDEGNSNRTSTGAWNGGGSNGAYFRGPQLEQFAREFGVLQPYEELVD